MSIISTISSFFASILKGLDVQRIMTVIGLYFVVAIISPDKFKLYITAKFPDVSYSIAYYVFLVPVSFFLMTFLFLLIKKVKKEVEIKKYNKYRKDVVDELTSVEKGYLVQFFQPVITDVIYIELSDHIAQNLISKGILKLLSSQGNYNYFERIPAKISKDFAELINNAYLEQNP